jgi:hypothetical protein
VTVTLLGDDVGVVRLPLASAHMRSGHLGMWESCSATIIRLCAPTTPLYLCGATSHFRARVICVQLEVTNQGVVYIFTTRNVL